MNEPKSNECPACGQLSLVTGLRDEKGRFLRTDPAHAEEMKRAQLCFACWEARQRVRRELEATARALRAFNAKA
jgi:hypothetical protein